MSLKEIVDIFRNFAISDSRFASFATIDRLEQLNTTNLEKVYSDYTKGYFWARAWEAGGAKRDELCVEWPLLYLEHKRSTMDRFGCVSHTIFAGIAEQVPCDDRNIEEIDRDNLAMLVAAIKNFINLSGNRYASENIEIFTADRGVDNLRMKVADFIVAADLEDGIDC